MTAMRNLPVFLLLLMSSAWAQGADFNADGRVDADDFFALADVFGQAVSESNRKFDLNGDGRIDFNDIYLVTKEFASIDNGGAQITDHEPDFDLRVDLPGGVTMDFALIEPGTFMMGTEGSRLGNEGPQHRVKISQGFYLGQFEITQRQWIAVMGTHPWSGRDNVVEGPDRPAVHVSWNDLQDFVERLNESLGEMLYRLPTEAEWEYACRAGTTSPWSFGEDRSRLGDYAWFVGNVWDLGLKYAQPVGSKLPNPWGLHDMHGNVWEWVQDRLKWFSSASTTDPQGPELGSFRVLRGDSGFGYFARDTRSAVRTGGFPGVREASIGARLLRMVPLPDTVSVEDEAVNLVPNAVAGPDQGATVGSYVVLDGSGSTDPDGDPLSYRWTQTVGPAIVLSDAADVLPMFLPELSGTYGFSLTVDDGHLGSVPDTVTITVAAQTIPIASAGRDTSVNLGAEVNLDGSGSRDPDGDPLSFQWTQIFGSTVVLSDATDVLPVFRPEKSGSYLFSLVVNDGHGDSVPDSVTIKVSPPGIPIAFAGRDRSVTLGDTVDLDGSGSRDPDGDSLSFQWTQTFGPTVILSDTADAHPVFLPEKFGDFRFSLTVDDGQFVSVPDTITITVNSKDRALWATPASTVHELVLVQAGPFEMGSELFSIDRPVHTVQLDGYYIDKFEVTNALYQIFVAATGWQQPSYAGDRLFNAAQQPVVGVTWFDAERYCGWAGLRLPTEAEWEKAARGTDERSYPWGEEIVDDMANFGVGTGTKVGTTTRVGSYPAGVSPYGAYDLAGNVWEWVADWFDGSYYRSNPVSNPIGPESGSSRVQRGGSWLEAPTTLRSSSRFALPPSILSFHLGFRCALSE